MAASKLAAMAKKNDKEPVEEAPKATGAPKKARDKKLSTYVTYDTWAALPQQKIQESGEGTRTVNDIVNDAVEMYLKQAGGPEKASK